MASEIVPPVLHGPRSRMIKEREKRKRALLVKEREEEESKGKKRLTLSHTHHSQSRILIGPLSTQKAVYITKNGSNLYVNFKSKGTSFSLNYDEWIELMEIFPDIHYELLEQKEINEIHTFQPTIRDSDSDTQPDSPPTHIYS